MIQAEVAHHSAKREGGPQNRPLVAVRGKQELVPFNLALVYLGLGDRARTLDNLERALAADSQMMPWISRDAIFDPIRSEPRFVALLNKMGVRP